MLLLIGANNAQGVCVCQGNFNSPQSDQKFQITMTKISASLFLSLTPETFFTSVPIPLGVADFGSAAAFFLFVL